MRTTTDRHLDLTMQINDEILIRYLDDQLDEESCREVAQAVCTDEAVAARLLELAELEVMLQETVEVLGEASDLVTQTRKNRRLRKGGLPRTALLLTGVCLAAAACLAITLAILLRPDKPSPTPETRGGQIARETGTPPQDRDLDPLLLIPIAESPGSEVLPISRENPTKAAKRMQVIRGRILTIDTDAARLEIGTDTGRLVTLRITKDTVIMGHSSLLSPIELMDNVQAALFEQADGPPQLRRLVVRRPDPIKNSGRGKKGGHRPD